MMIMMKGAMMMIDNRCLFSLSLIEYLRVMFVCVKLKLSSVENIQLLNNRDNLESCKFI